VFKDFSRFQGRPVQLFSRKVRRRFQKFAVDALILRLRPRVYRNHPAEEIVKFINRQIWPPEQVFGPPNHQKSLIGGNPMDTREIYKEKIEKQLSKWKTTIDSLKTKIEQTEQAARARLHTQLDSLHSKRARAEKLLEELSATSQDAWEEIKSSVEKGWNEVMRTAKETTAKVRQSIAHPNREEEIRQIAYQLWLNEGCPHGRHLDHWLEAESIWREQQAAKQPEHVRLEKAKPKRKPAAAAPHTKGRTVKTKTSDAPVRRDIEKL
jgi:hypothetical protein